MGMYRSNPDAIAALVRDDQVHADVYVSPELHALEEERLFRRTWQYVGHASQVPGAGDFFTTVIAGQPLIMVRHADGSVRVLINRCAHKGATVLTAQCGNTGKVLRCPYHSWTYKLDGSLLAMPLRGEYESTSVHECNAGQGLGVPATASRRGFVFIRLDAEGIDFESFAGPMLDVLDNLADRSPEGELNVMGGCLRSVIKCNWKMYLENINDAVHAISTHESVVSATTKVWNAQTDRTRVPMSVEQLLPFGLGLDFAGAMGARVLDNGHSILGTQASLHSGYAALGDYEASLAAAHGVQRAREILSFSPQNAVLYPGLALKCSPQVMRVVRPLAADRTLVEAWALAPRGAPPELLQRTLNYNRLVFSPMSAVAHDDIHIFENMQRSLHARGNPWVSLHRLHHRDERADERTEHAATSEILMRNQFRAWARFMVADPGNSTAGST